MSRAVWPIPAGLYRLVGKGRSPAAWAQVQAAEGPVPDETGGDRSPGETGLPETLGEPRCRRRSLLLTARYMHRVPQCHRSFVLRYPQPLTNQRECVWQHPSTAIRPTSTREARSVRSAVPDCIMRWQCHGMCSAQAVRRLAARPSRANGRGAVH